MNFRFIFLVPKRLAPTLAQAALVLASSSVAVFAQTDGAALAGGAASAQADTSRGSYRSAFEGYRPYTDEKIISWQGANDTAGRIGGWREYARESAPAAPASKAPDATAKPDPHAGHGKP